MIWFRVLVTCLASFHKHRMNLPPQTTLLPMEVKGVIFDLDGTLLETEKLGCHTVYHILKDQMSKEAKTAFENRNFRMEWELKKQTLSLPDNIWVPIVLKWAVEKWGVTDPPTVDEFLEKWDTTLWEHMCTAEACEGAKELVLDLADTKKLSLAIATSSRAAAVEQKRHHVDLFERFPTIVSGDDPAVTNGKPAPDIYLEAAHRMNVKPEHCIVVEDGMSGVQAGKAAGCFVVAVPDSRCSAEERVEFEKIADIVLDSLRQFNENILLPALASSDDD